MAIMIKIMYLLKFFVRTNSFADSFYKVRTTIESVISQDVSKSFLSQAQQEEKRKNINYDLISKLKAFTEKKMEHLINSSQ